MQQTDGFLYENKPVFDWNHVPVGEIATAERDPKTRGMRRLVLHLSPEARTRLGVETDSLALPASFVFGMRRDEVTLDRSLDDLRRVEFATHLLKR